MKILLALDNSACSHAAVQTVTSLFKPAGTEVLVFHAANWEAQLPISYQFAQGPHAVEDVLAVRDETLKLANEYVSGVATQLSAAGFAATSEVSAEGEPRDAILRVAERWRPDLIVVGSHGRAGLNRLILGSVSEGIVRGAHCSVQVVREPMPHDATAVGESVAAVATP